MDKGTTKLDVFEFGRKLLETNDLDPVYVMLANSSLKDYDLYAWLLAYWCFYHAGTASWILERYGRGEYWFAMMKAAKSKDYPRCPERRHFRGANAVNSIEYLQRQGISGIFQDFERAAFENRTLQASEAIDYVLEWVGFGHWISFKVADMLERLGIVKVHFDVKTIQLFDSPAEGARIVWEDHHRGLIQPPDIVPWATRVILDELGHNLAPPRYERKINIQEVETILCKFKSYRSGHYEIGEDILSLRRALLKFAGGRTNQELLKAGQRGRLW